MREIDPQSVDPQSSDRLSAALRRLAANSSQSAPPELGEMLKAEFHRRHVRRKRVLIAALTAVAACLVVFAASLLSRKSSAPDSGTTKAPAIALPSAKDKPVVTAPVVAKTSSSRKHRVRALTSAAATMAAESGDFMALPSYDPAMAPGDLQIVRLELTGAELSMLGAPVTETLTERRIRADFLVGRDGTPYGVRLVQ
jgi:hypothetical protein